ncbi:MAG: thioredoxin family protein [Pirellulales bacterium]
MLRRTFFNLGLVVVAIVLVGCSSGSSTPSAGNGDKWADHTQGLPFVIGYDAGMAKAQAEKKPAMLFVTTTWCGWCKKLAADDLTDPDVRRLLELFVLVIVDGDTEKGAARALGANGFPHIVFKGPDGEDLGTIPGYVPVDQFKAAVEQALVTLDSKPRKVAVR